MLTLFTAPNDLAGIQIGSLMIWNGLNQVPLLLLGLMGLMIALGIIIYVLHKH